MADRENAEQGTQWRPGWGSGRAVAGAASDTKKHKGGGAPVESRRGSPKGMKVTLVSSNGVRCSATIPSSRVLIHNESHGDRPTIRPRTKLHALSLMIRCCREGSLDASLSAASSVVSVVGTLFG